MKYFDIYLSSNGKLRPILVGIAEDEITTYTRAIEDVLREKEITGTIEIKEEVCCCS